MNDNLIMDDNNSSMNDNNSSMDDNEIVHKYLQMPWCLGTSWVITLCMEIYYNIIPEYSTCPKEPVQKYCCKLLNDITCDIIVTFFVLIIYLIVDIFQIIFGILTCNICCCPCFAFPCCKIVLEDEYFSNVRVLNKYFRDTTKIICPCCF